MTTGTLPQARDTSDERKPAVLTPGDLGLPDEPVRAGAKDSPAAHVRAKLDAQVRTVLAEEPGTRAGVDPEHLHQMRVAIRRMRSVLKIAGLAEAGEQARAELGWLGNALGEVRDFDVLIMHLREVVAEFEAVDQLAARQLVAKFVARRGHAKRRLTRVLDSERYRETLRLVAELSRAEGTPPAESKGKAEAAPVELVAALRKPYRKLRKAVAALPENPPDDDLHELRIHGKRLRYAGELARPAAADKTEKRAVKTVIKASERLQTVLGDHQDAVIAADRVREVAATADGPVAFIAGRVVELEHARCAAARAAWPAVVAEIDAAAETLGAKVTG